MAVVVPIRFASEDPARRRDRIVRLLRDHGMDVRRGDVDGLGELYLLRAQHAVGFARASIIELLEQHVPGWQAAVEFYSPE